MRWLRRSVRIACHPDRDEDDHVKRSSPLTVATRLVCAALLAVLMFLEGSARAGRPPPPAMTTRAVSDGASTIAELRARLRVPDIQPGQDCPKPDVNLRLNGVGPAVNVGPVAAAVFSEDVRLEYADERQERWHDAKVLWLVHADQRQPVIVRGKRVDRCGAVQFSNGLRGFRTYPLMGDAESTAPPEWRDIPSSVRVRERGSRHSGPNTKRSNGCISPLSSASTEKLGDRGAVYVTRFVNPRSSSSVHQRRSGPSESLSPPGSTP
jgi:hypothetical protein